jgi:hypothetical protein
MRHDSKVTANGLHQREEEESSSDDFGRFKTFEKNRERGAGSFYLP